MLLAIKQSSTFACIALDSEKGEVLVVLLESFRVCRSCGLRGECLFPFLLFEFAVLGPTLRTAWIVWL